MLDEIEKDWVAVLREDPSHHPERLHERPRRRWAELSQELRDKFRERIENAYRSANDWMTLVEMNRRFICGRLPHVRSWPLPIDEETKAIEAGLLRLLDRGLYIIQSSPASYKYKQYTAQIYYSDGKILEVCYQPGYGVEFVRIPVSQTSTGAQKPSQSTFQLNLEEADQTS